LALLAVLIVIGALAAPGLLGRGGDQNASGSNNAGQNRAQDDGNAGPSGGGSGGDQGPGGGQNQGAGSTVGAEQSASPQTSSVASAPSGNSPGQGSLTAQAAEQTVRQVYTTAADGDYDASYGLLSEDFKATKAPTQPSWSVQFDTLESIRFVEGPNAQVSGNTATVTGVTIAALPDETQRNTASWTLVNEGEEWRLNSINIENREIL
jgi:serine/threonine-protein kinase